MEIKEEYKFNDRRNTKIIGSAGEAALIIRESFLTRKTIKLYRTYKEGEIVACSNSTLKRKYRKSIEVKQIFRDAGIPTTQSIQNTKTLHDLLNYQSMNDLEKDIEKGIISKMTLLSIINALYRKMHILE